jgi:uncharacterized membrane protein
LNDNGPATVDLWFNDGQTIMTDIGKLLNRWQSAGVLDAGTAARIRAWEDEQNRGEDAAQPLRVAGLAWQGVVALILGGILLATGVILFVSAHWDEMGPGSRFALVLAIVAVFHLAGGFVRERFLALSTVFHAVGTVCTGAAIALVGQIFNIEEHWPAAVLIWAISALAGWVLLHDQAQQIFALLLFPAWLFCELEFYSHQHIGQEIYLGRFLLVWAVRYWTVLLGSKRRAVHGVLFAAAAVAAISGTALMASGWLSWSSSQTFLPFGTRFWAWAAIAALPLAVAAFKGHWGLVPPASAIAFAILLPWCQHFSTSYYEYGQGVKSSYTRSDPNLAAYLFVAGFAVFIIAWGVRQVSRALVNLGVVYFAMVVAWFYWSNILDKVGRSLGLIGLGILFLAGGWALEVTRRKLLVRMEQPRAAAMEAR